MYCISTFWLSPSSPLPALLAAFWLQAARDRTITMASRTAYSFFIVVTSKFSLRYLVLHIVLSPVRLAVLYPSGVEKSK